jgi:hypothetical protein
VRAREEVVVIEVFPEKVDEKKAAAQLEKLVSAFLSVATEEAAEEGREDLDTTASEAREDGPGFSTAPGNPLATSCQPRQQGVSA